MAIWRPRTLKAGLGAGFVVAPLVAAGIYAATRERVSVRVEWDQAPSLPYANRAYGARVPEPGSRLLVGDVVLANAGLREVQGRQVQFEMVGTDGIVYPEAYVPADPWDIFALFEGTRLRSDAYVGLRHIDSLPAMVRGGRLSCNVIFEVPKGVEPRKLRLKRAEQPGREGRK